jgi:hypothetical protein
MIFVFNSFGNGSWIALWFSNPQEEGKGTWNTWKIGNGALDKGDPAPLDKYIIFQLTSRYSIFSITPSQIYLALKEAPNRRPRYFIGKEKTP